MLALALRVCVGGSVWIAIPCATFIWTARHGTGRTRFTAHGDATNERVHQANTMVKRVVGIAVLMWLRCVHVHWEQPISSLLRHVPEIKEFFQYCCANSARTYLGPFGAKSIKPVDIFSTSPLVNRLRRQRPWARLSPETQHMVKLTITTRKGRGTVQGHKKVMPASAAYPKRCGEEVAQMFEAILVSDKGQTLLTHFFNSTR